MVSNNEEGDPEPLKPRPRTSSSPETALARVLILSSSSSSSTLFDDRGVTGCEQNADGGISALGIDLLWG